MAAPMMARNSMAMAAPRMARRSKRMSPAPMAFDSPSTFSCALESVCADSMMDDSSTAPDSEPTSPVDPLLQLVSLQKASGHWELKAALADVFGKTEDELANHRPAQVDGSVWATVLALIWLHTCRSEDQVEWQFVAMKAEAWIRSQKPDGLSQCVCDGNLLLGGHVTEDALGI